jgi:hypothetical protein
MVQALREGRKISPSLRGKTKGLSLFSKGKLGGI